MCWGTTVPCAAVEALGVECAVLPLPGSLAGLGDAALSKDADADRLAHLAFAKRGPQATFAAAGYAAILRGKFAEWRPDLVHTNGMKAHILGAWSAPRGVPIAWHLHDYIGSRRFMGYLLRLTERMRARHGRVHGVAVSRSVAADARDSLGPGFEVEEVYNAADLDRFRPGPGDGAALDAACGMPEAGPGAVRVGLVATYATWKGHVVFLDAAESLLASGAIARPCRFYVVGGPIYRLTGSQHTAQGLRALAVARGLGDRVGFAGHQSEPADAMRALDVVVHASTRPEPFGRVIVEAMACGRAVVAAKGGGAAELFRDGDEALGTPPGDVEALASAMARLAVDDALRARLGAAGRRAAEARFDRRGLPDRWISVYERCLTPPHAARAAAAAAARAGGA